MTQLCVCVCVCVGGGGGGGGGGLSLAPKYIQAQAFSIQLQSSFQVYMT